jgi:hypothetical protein
MHHHKSPAHPPPAPTSPSAHRHPIQRSRRRQHHVDTVSQAVRLVGDIFAGMVCGADAAMKGRQLGVEAVVVVGGFARERTEGGGAGPTTS